jgi:hypothetical protein
MSVANEGLTGNFGEIRGVIVKFKGLLAVEWCGRSERRPRPEALKHNAADKDTVLHVVLSLI